MTFFSIVRQWCRIYKPMLDSPTNGNRRFYFTDSPGGVVEMAKGIVPTLSPFVMMEATLEGGGKITRPDFNYPIYFFVRARQMKDGDAAAEAISEAWMHCSNFLAWLKKKHDDEVSRNIDGDFARIDLDSALIDIGTTGAIEDGWYAVYIQFVRAEPLNLCVNEDLYVDNN